MLAETGEFPTDFELLEDTLKRKSDGVVIDPKTIQIIEEVKKKADEQLSQRSVCEDGSETIQPQELTKAEIDDLFKATVPIKKGRRYGMGSALDGIATSSSFTSSPVITTL